MPAPSWTNEYANELLLQEAIGNDLESQIFIENLLVDITDGTKNAGTAFDEFMNFFKGRLSSPEPLISTILDDFISDVYWELVFEEFVIPAQAAYDEKHRFDHLEYGE